MNTPSPAPRRRRRQPGPQAYDMQRSPGANAPPDPPDAYAGRTSPDPWTAEPLSPSRYAQRMPRLPQLSEHEYGSLPSHGSQPSHGRQPPSSKSARGKRRSASPLATMPTPLRLALIAICAVVLIVSAVAVTRDYLAKQEERRRLEAEAAERAQHPLLYPEMIVQYAAQQDLDPALVSAIILCESSFDPQAESRIGARGLMQLMEDTAQWIAHKLGEDTQAYTFDLLYDPETNIRFGTWYLGYLSRRFSGDATKIVCAYHAGQGNVDSWLANPEYSADGVTLDVIPTEDTAAYAARVLRARDVYRKYYFPEGAPVQLTAPVD